MIEILDIMTENTYSKSIANGKPVNNDKQEELINGLLASHVNIPLVFDDFKLVILFKNFDDPFAILRRECYLNSINIGENKFGIGEVFCKISLSEALAYINTVTPPILKKQLGELNSLETVIDILKIYLIEQTDEYKQDIFKRITHLKASDSDWIPSEKIYGKLKILKDKIDIGKGIFILEYSAVPIETLVRLKSVLDISTSDEFDYFVKGVKIYKRDDANNLSIFSNTRFYEGIKTDIFVGKDYVFLNVFNNEITDAELSLIKNTYGSFYK